MGFLALASASAAAVWCGGAGRGWQWPASGLTLAQVAMWAALTDVPAAQLVGVLSVFAALNLALALGYELRVATAGLEASSALLVPSGALILGALGYFGLPSAPASRRRALARRTGGGARALAGIAFRLAASATRSGW